MPRTLLNVYHFIKKLIQSIHTNNQFSLRVPSLHINHFSLRVPSLHINQISLRVPSLHIKLTSLRVRPTIKQKITISPGPVPQSNSIPIKVYFYKSISLIIIPFKMTNNSIHMVIILTHLAVYSCIYNNIFISNKTL